MPSDNATSASTASLERFCGNCGYDLRASAAGRCPECGEEFNPAVAPADIPWLRRRSIGLVSAYARTIWRVVAHTREFVEMAARGAELHGGEARRFRNSTLIIAFVPLVLDWMLALISLTPATRITPMRLLVGAIVGPICVGLWLWLATGYWPLFGGGNGGVAQSPAQRRALRDYASAALALTTIPVIFGAAFEAADHFHFVGFRYSFTKVIFVLVLAGEAALALVAAGQIFRHAIGVKGLALVFRMIVLFGWWALLGIIFVVFPLLALSLGPVVALRFLIDA
jgi:hypothetical protein